VRLSILRLSRLLPMSLVCTKPTLPERVDEAVIRESWGPWLGPAAATCWTLTKVDVAQAGDSAYHEPLPAPLPVKKYRSQVR